MSYDKLIKTKKDYNNALKRIEELFDAKAGSPEADELELLVALVELYEKEHFPIEKPTVAELISLALEEMNMTQKELATVIGVSASRINDYVTGRAEPTLKTARLICKTLRISPAAMMGI